MNVVTNRYERIKLVLPDTTDSCNISFKNDAMSLECCPRILVPAWKGPNVLSTFSIAGIEAQIGHVLDSVFIRELAVFQRKFKNPVNTDKQYGKSS